MPYSMGVWTVLSSPISCGSPDRSRPKPSDLNSKRKQQCARCGSCSVVCPVFRVTGRETLAARGKLHLLSTGLAEDPSGHFQDIFSQCLLCGACEDVCSRGLSVREAIVAARSRFSHLYGRNTLKRLLVRKTLANSVLLEGLVRAGLSLSRLSLLPAESGLRIKLGLLERREENSSASRDTWAEQKASDSTGLSYFSGCMARYLQPSIGEATERLVGNITGKPLRAPDGQVCCGLAAWSAGSFEEARKLARNNIEVFSRGAGPIITSCASCSSHLKQYPALFADDPEWKEKAAAVSARVVEFTSYIQKHLHARELAVSNPVRVHYHEPCHLRFDPENRGRALQLLEQIGNVFLLRPGETHHCCGQGGLFHLGYPELSGEIFARAHEQLGPESADVVLTTCSGCLMQWQAGLAARQSQVKAVHLAVWLLSCMPLND